MSSSRTIGKYQIQGEIGKGGFGTVYRAWDPTVNRAVAIKVLTVSGDEDLLTRFRNEAASTGNLHHRNIVTIHDFGEHDGTPYMVMQLLEGQTLQEVIVKKAPLTMIQRMQIMGQVADGLNYAHQHGLIHRDVKPANIMILSDSTVQIMDFGIARVTASTSRQTRTGFVIGTVLYMAPEQFLPGKHIDHRIDIWAFGVMYYELLTGKHPFSSADEMSTLYQVAHVEPPPVRSLAPDVPAALEEVVHRLLAKDPDLRYSSLREVNFDIQPILVELKREQAAEMVSHARQLASDEQYEEAHARAQEILELDPSNREAHLLLQSLKQRMQRKLIEPKIQSLVQKAEQDVQARAWQPAIDALQSALRLNPADTTIQARLEQIRGLSETSRKVEKLVLDAQRELKARNFTAAFRIASEAAKTDPASASASHLLEQIQHEIEIRDSDRQRDEALAKVRSMLLMGEFGKAMAELDRLSAAFPNDEAVAAALRNAHDQQRVSELTATVEDAIEASDFGRAASLVQIGQEEFPENTKLTQLAAKVTSARQAFELNLAQTRIRQEIDAGEFAIAADFLSVARKRFPSDPRLIAMEEELRRKTEKPKAPPVAPLASAAAPAAAAAPARVPEPPPAPRPAAVPAPQPTPAPRIAAQPAAANRLPVILGSAAVVMLCIIGAVVALRPTTRPQVESPAATAPTTQPAAETPSPSAAPPPAASEPQHPAPAAEPVQQPVHAPTHLPTPIATAKPKPAAPKEEEDDVAEAPAQPAQPASTSGVRVGATAVSAGRVVQSGPKWSGSATGRMVWTGQLPPGSRIVMNGQRGVIEGPGALTSDPMPALSDVDIVSINPYGSLVVAASGPNLTVGNTGTQPVSRIEITWRVKAQQ